MGRQRGIQYRGGSFYRQDDRSGFTRRAGDTQQEWNGLIVSKNLWETRQPQDFVRGVVDDQTVPNPRSEQPNAFVGPVYTQTGANVAIGATFIPLAAVNGFTAGFRVGVLLSTGAYFNTTQVGAALASGINIATPMPNTAQSGNDVVCYGAVGP